MSHRIHFKNYGTYTFHIIAILFFSFPILWAFSTALKTPREVALFPPSFFPNQISWHNFFEILTAYDNTFFIMLLNTIWITFATSILVACISTLAGYAFTFFEFPGKEFVFVVMLSTILVPFQGLLVPLFDLMAKFQLVNTYLCLIIIYTTFQLPFGIFMMRNAFSSLPGSLRESSILDGGGELRTMWSVMLPLALPGVLTTIVYSVYVTWNDYLIALVFNTKKSMSMLTVGLQNLAMGTYGAHWETLMAGSIISFVPVILLYAFLQQYFIRGITGSAVKE